LKQKLNHKRTIQGKLEQHEIVKSLLMQDPFRHLLLITLRDFKEKDLWIGGGFIRNLVWDFIHSYPLKTELGDIDVFYFDPNNTEKKTDTLIEKVLRKKLSNVNWSVKNQARMHLHNSEEQYKNLDDAISKFPETVSAIICKLNHKNEIEIIAPYGLDDLFQVVVRPTPHFKNSDAKMQRFKSRSEQKNWGHIWTKLITEKL